MQGACESLGPTPPQKQRRSALQRAAWSFLPAGKPERAHWRGRLPFTNIDWQSLLPHSRGIYPAWQPPPAHLVDTQRLCLSIHLSVRRSVRPSLPPSYFPSFLLPPSPDSFLPSSPSSFFSAPSTFSLLPPFFLLLTLFSLSTDWGSHSGTQL